jgi:MoxR-like ATPase
MKFEAAVDLNHWRTRAAEFETELGKAILGQGRVIRLLTVAIFARGHVLLEGDVGVGKTTLLRAAARCLGGSYERIEGTIDLMPPISFITPISRRTDARASILVRYFAAARIWRYFSSTKSTAPVRRSIRSCSV